MDIKELHQRLNEQLAKSIGMELNHSDEGFSLGRLYQMAGMEDRVITISFRNDSPSRQIWGDSITCCLIYTERERLQLQAKMEKGENNYGKAKARYLLFDLSKELVERLEKEGFDSQDVEEVLVAPNLSPENVYKGEELRKLNTIDIPLDPEPPLDELKFAFGVLNHFRNDGMNFTPAEYDDYTALRLVLGIPLFEEEKANVFDSEGRIYNNNVSRLYLLYKGRLGTLSDEKQKQQVQLEVERLSERMIILDNHLKEMGSSLDKLKASNEAVYKHLMFRICKFKEIRLNAIGKFPIFLDFEGYVHIGLRHITEWQFCDYYAERDKFQLKEEDVVRALKMIVEDINDDYQTIKEARPDYQYRKFGKNSLYLNGDYYMIHIGENGRIENFSKNVDKKFSTD
ncbi:MAG: hypothetical protein ACI3ZK_02945 [Candidatus Cryptobacteroides sp.]